LWIPVLGEPTEGNGELHIPRGITVLQYSTSFLTVRGGPNRPASLPPITFIDVCEITGAVHEFYRDPANIKILVVVAMKYFHQKV
jgi:hypothetical protein